MAFVRGELRGVRHLNRLGPLTPQAGELPTITVTVEVDRAIETVLCRLSEPMAQVIPLRLVDVRWDMLNWSYFQVWQVQLPAQDEGAVVRYTIEAQPRDGGSPILADEDATFSYLVADPSPPDWTAGAVIYQIMPDRFRHGAGRSWNEVKSPDDVFGGTLRGIIEKLDYIADLGFNCLWLNPFFPDETHHGYHATDYFTVNPRLGTEADIRDLVDGAHARGIRLLLDFVANHWGSNHETFRQAQADRKSVYHHWYNWIEWPQRYKTFFGVQDLPQINLDHPAAREHLLEAARFWLQDFDFDGYRLDYALGPGLDFWTDFRAMVKAAKPEAWIFGEVVHPPATQLKYWGRLDGLLDFALQQALRNTFAFGDMSLSAFDAFLEQHETYFPADFSRPSFLDNHDVNRFLWLVDGDVRKLKLAALCQFTLAGQPIVYYGTEVGLSQERDLLWPDGRHVLAESRQPMLWGDEQDRELHTYYRWLVRFRRAHSVLWRGQRRTVHLDGEAGTYAYVRSNAEETIVVALNASDRARTITASGHTFELDAWSGDVAVVGPTRPQS